MSEKGLTIVLAEDKKKIEECVHPFHKRTFIGVQTNARGEPSLILSNCEVCGTTRSDCIAHSDILWWAIGQLAERTVKLENKVSQTLPDLT